MTMQRRSGQIRPGASIERQVQGRFLDHLDCEKKKKKKKKKKGFRFAYDECWRWMRMGVVWLYIVETRRRISFDHIMATCEFGEERFVHFI
jgi:hypothetical protein